MGGSRRHGAAPSSRSIESYLMKIIYRYIIRELLYYFAVFFLIFLVVLVTKELYDTRDEIFEEKPAVADTVRYIALVIPNQLVEAIPLLTLFSVLFAMGMLSKNREILAMVAAGVPFERLAIPVAVFGTIIGLSTFLLADQLAPRAQAQARYVYEVKIKGENQYAFSGEDEVFSRGEPNRIYIMANFDRERLVMTSPTILIKTPGDNTLSERIEARRATFVGTSRESDRDLWEFEDMQHWRFKPDGAVEWTRYEEPRTLELENRLESFITEKRRVDEMGMGELAAYSIVLNRQGGGPRLAVYETAYHRRTTILLSSLLLALIGFAAAVDIRRPSFMLAFSVGLGLGLGFYLLREGFGSLGEGAYLPSWFAGWGPAMLATPIVVYLLYRLRVVH